MYICDKVHKPQNLNGRTGKPTWALEPVVLVISFMGGVLTSRRIGRKIENSAEKWH